MATVKKNVITSYSAAQMYALVNDIEHYPDFLPWCQSAEVHSKTDHEVRATLSLAMGGIHKSFTTSNRLQPNKRIDMHLLKGPFRQFEGFWEFEAVGENACRVTLDLEFEFEFHWLSAIAEPLFTKIVSSLVDAFCQRAKEVYGEQSQKV